RSEGRQARACHPGRDSRDHARPGASSVMGTLASELGPHVERLTGQPRVYVDANVPTGLVSFMRNRLQWDVLFVMEHEDLRRASDDAHFRLARQLRRTLI